MSRATDPINPVNPLCYSFRHFLTQNQNIGKYIKILLVFENFPLRGIGKGIAHYFIVLGAGLWGRAFFIIKKEGFIIRTSKRHFL